MTHDDCVSCCMHTLHTLNLFPWTFRGSPSHRRPRNQIFVGSGPRDPTGSAPMTSDHLPLHYQTTDLTVIICGGCLALYMSITSFMSTAISRWTNNRSSAFSLSSPVEARLSLLTNLRAEFALSTVALLTGASSVMRISRYCCNVWETVCTCCIVTKYFYFVTLITT